MKKTKKLLTLLLVACLVMSSLAACGKEKSNNPGSDKVSNETHKDKGTGKDKEGPSKAEMIEPETEAKTTPVEEIVGTIMPAVIENYKNTAGKVLRIMMTDENNNSITVCSGTSVDEMSKYSSLDIGGAFTYAFYLSSTDYYSFYQSVPYYCTLPDMKEKVEALDEDELVAEFKAAYGLNEGDTYKLDDMIVFLTNKLGESSASGYTDLTTTNGELPDANEDFISTEEVDEALEFYDANSCTIISEDDTHLQVSFIFTTAVEGQEGEETITGTVEFYINKETNTAEYIEIKAEQNGAYMECYVESIDFEFFINNAQDAYGIIFTKEADYTTEEISEFAAGSTLSWAFTQMANALGDADLSFGGEGEDEGFSFSGELDFNNAEVTVGGGDEN